MPSRRYAASPRGVGAGASLGKDVSDDNVQVERDVKEVALSVLANEARMARSDEVIRKVKVTELFLETETCRAGLMGASTFKVRVHRLKQNLDVQREALALVNEECDSSSQLSDETAYDENEVVRTRSAERRQNPQLWFEQVVRKVSDGVITAAEGVGAMRGVDVRVTQNFVKSAMCALSFGDAIPRLSECEDRRGRPSALSNAYSDQLAKIVKQRSIQLGFRPYFLENASREPCPFECRCFIKQNMAREFCKLPKSGCDLRSSDFYVVHEKSYAVLLPKLLDLKQANSKRIIDTAPMRSFANQWLILPQASIQTKLDIPMDYQIGLGALYVKKCVMPRPVPRIASQQILFNSGQYV